MTTADADRHRYIELHDRSRHAITIGASAIMVLIIGSTWGNPEQFAAALILHAVMYPMNVVFDRFVVRRLGPVSEVVRTLVNTALCGYGYGVIGWPVAVWLWLPFIALAFGQFGGKYTAMSVAIMCIGPGAAGILQGAPAIYPVVFGVFAVVCWHITTTRAAIIVAMLDTAEHQRDELAEAHQQLKDETSARERAEQELRQAQKLEAIGRLAAGVAHEINTPIQYIGNNLEFIAEATSELLAHAQGKTDAADLPYLASHLPSALADVSDGVSRVAAIVRSMKQFSHPEVESDRGELDVAQAIETTLVMCQHEYKLVADVDLALDGLPVIECNVGEINQVFLNLVINAAHAIGEVFEQTHERGRLTIAGTRQGGDVVITITDTGPGIPDHVRPHIFELFFTTKEVGRGTGQGLALARATIERHGGKLTFETTVGVGTTFQIRLPTLAGVVAAVRHAA